MTINEQIALLIQQQTYAERMAMAQFFASLDEHTADYIASALDGWAEDNEPKGDDE